VLFAPVTVYALYQGSTFVVDMANGNSILQYEG